MIETTATSVALADPEPVAQTFLVLVDQSLCASAACDRATNYSPLQCQINTSTTSPYLHWLTLQRLAFACTLFQTYLWTFTSRILTSLYRGRQLISSRANRERLKVVDESTFNDTRTYVQGHESLICVSWASVTPIPWYKDKVRWSLRMIYDYSYSYLTWERNTFTLIFVWKWASRIFSAVSISSKYDPSKSQPWGRRTSHYNPLRGPACLAWGHFLHDPAQWLKTHTQLVEKVPCVPHTSTYRTWYLVRYVAPKIIWTALEWGPQ